MELTPVGKLFFGGLIAWIAKDAKLHFKIKGTPEQMQAMTKAIFASKRFMDGLKKPNMTIEQILQLLNDKNASSEAFRQITGTSWPI